MKVPSTERRLMRLEGNAADNKVSAALSSEMPVDRFFGREVLRHTPDAIDFERAAEGLPVMLNHDTTELPIGRAQGIRLDDDGKLRGDLVFSDKTAAAREAFALVEEGTLSDVSIGYRILDWEKGEMPEDVTVTRWMPFEVSIVSVPADSSVGINRTMEAGPMPEENSKSEAGPVSITDSIKARSTAGFAAGAKAEGARLNDINATTTMLCRAMPSLAPELEALAEIAREDINMSSDVHRKQALELVGNGGQPLSVEGGDTSVRSAPTAGAARQPLVLAGEDSRDKFRTGAELALYARCGGVQVKDDDLRNNEMRGWSLLDYAEKDLQRAGINTRALSREQLAKRAIMIANRAIEGGAATGGATSDYASVTSNVATKFAFDGFMQADITYDQWCSIGSAPDFKAFEVPRLSAFGDLPVVAENAQYVGQQMVDANEAGQLAKYGATLALTWEATVNDDLSMFSRNAFRMGEAAARTVDNTVYAVLTANPGAGPVMGPVMGDTNQLFDGANHANVGAAALDLDGLIATRTLMGRQTDENSVLLGVRLDTVLVPLELEDAARNLSSSEYLPFDAPSGTGGSPRVNTVRGSFSVVSTAKLTDVNDWFGLARPGQTMEVVFLNGQRTPTLEQEMGWSYDTLNWKVRHVFDVLPMDWRGFAWNSVT